MGRAENKAERLRQAEIELLHAARREGISVQELATRLGVGRHTARRYVNTLSVNGVPVQEDNHRFWINPADYISHVLVNVGESLMLYLAMRRAVRQMSYVPPMMLSALEKMTFALRHPTNQLLASTAQYAQASHPVDQDRAQVWDTLVHAWVEQITVFLTYQGPHHAEPRVYEFQPYLFEPALLSEGVYVIGRSLTHQSLRTFKVERILKVSLTTHKFVRDDTLDVNNLVQSAWGIWYGETLTEVRLRFSPQIARRVKESIWHPNQRVTDLPDGGVEWCVEIAGVTELIPWIRGWGPDVEVVSPPDLRQRIAEDTRRAAALYDREKP